jgi:hypothetical protein
VRVLWWLHLLHRQLPELPGELGLHSILQRDAIGAIVLVVAGYAFQIASSPVCVLIGWRGKIAQIATEGKRHHQLIVSYGTSTRGRV